MKKYTIELTADEIRTVISALEEATDRRIEQHTEHTVRASKFFNLLIVFENKWRDICNKAFEEWQQQIEKK